MNKNYIKPNIKIQKFRIENVITTSGEITTAKNVAEGTLTNTGVTVNGNKITVSSDKVYTMTW